MNHKDDDNLKKRDYVKKMDIQLVKIASNLNGIFYIDVNTLKSLKIK